MVPTCSHIQSTWVTASSHRLPRWLKELWIGSLTGWTYKPFSHQRPVISSTSRCFLNLLVSSKFSVKMLSILGSWRAICWLLWIRMIVIVITEMTAIMIFAINLDFGFFVCLSSGRTHLKLEGIKTRLILSKWIVYRHPTTKKDTLNDRGSAALRKLIKWTGPLWHKGDALARINACYIIYIYI